MLQNVSFAGWGFLQQSALVAACCAALGMSSDAVTPLDELTAAIRAEHQALTAAVDDLEIQASTEEPTAGDATERAQSVQDDHAEPEEGSSNAGPKLPWQLIDVDLVSPCVKDETPKSDLETLEPHSISDSQGGWEGPDSLPFGGTSDLTAASSSHAVDMIAIDAARERVLAHDIKMP